MKIESIIQRPGGSFIPMGDVTYHFAPTDKDGRHTAEVEDDDHIARFLSIREGYRLAKEKDATPPVGLRAIVVNPGEKVRDAVNDLRDEALARTTAAPATPGPSTPAPETEPPAPAPATPAPDATGAPATGADEGDDLDAKTKPQLLEIVKDENVQVDTTLPKPALLNAIRTARAAKAGK